MSGVVRLQCMRRDALFGPLGKTEQKERYRLSELFMFHKEAKQEHKKKNGRLKSQRVEGRRSPHKGWGGGGEQMAWEEQTGGAAIKER